MSFTDSLPVEKTLTDANVIICVGSGGVGKTTVSSAIAMRAAQIGRKVLVLTVDPAKRLKSTMGLDSTLQSEIHHSSITGSLTAAVIDNKRIFDDFVSRITGSEDAKEKILNNKLYIQLSTTLSGSQEFTALEKLYSSYLSGSFDLIVLDTPPAQHAMDFLGAPKKLAFLFNEKITKWFRASGKNEKLGFLASLIQTGTRQVIRALEILTGSEFIRELSDFFQNIHAWQGQIEQRILRVNQLLLANKTRFVLVTSFDKAKLKEAQQIFKDIKKGGYHLAAVVINRAFPKGIDLNLNIEPKSELDLFYLVLQKYYQDKDKSFYQFSKDIPSHIQVIRLPELQNHVSDLDGVFEMTENLKEVF